MEFDDLQRAWQAQNPAAHITIKADLLLKEVRRNQRQFWATIFWRDVREVGAAVLLTVWFLYEAVRDHAWSYGLCALLCAGVGVYIIVDRLAQKKTQPSFNGTLKGCIEASLAQVNHQIWLLKNVFWWYLLPLLVASAISMWTKESHRAHFDHAAAVGVLITVVLIAWFFRWVYRLNQSAVTKTLQPRQEELKALLASLS